MHHPFDGADFFSLLSDELRRRILVLLMSEQELCVCELFFALDAIQPKVSRHLALMREAGLLNQRKRGRWVNYRIASQVPLWAHRILVSMTDGVEGCRPYVEDKKRLAAMPNRPERRLEPLHDNGRNCGTEFNTVAPGTELNASLRRATTGD